MVMDIRKHLISTYFIIPNNFCFNNFSKKSIPGDVLALGLLLAVYGPGLGPDVPGCRDKPYVNQPSWSSLTTLSSTTFLKNQSLGMSGLRSSRNLLAPPTLIWAGFPEVLLSGLHPGAKSFPTVPQTWLYIAWAPDYLPTNAEFNID